MNEPYPGVILCETVRRRNRWLLAFAGVLPTAFLGYLIARSVSAISHGDTGATTSFHGIDIPTWALGPLGLILVPLAWWGWRRESVVIVKRQSLVGIQPLKDGFVLTGNFRRAIGTSLLVSDNSFLRVALVNTKKGEQGLMQLYGLRLASPQGNVVMELDLRPSAFDLGPLLAELRRRRVSIEMDPELESRSVSCSATPDRRSFRRQGLRPPSSSGPPPSPAAPPSSAPVPYR